MTEQAIAEWFVNLSIYPALALAIGEYNPSLDYAGPENNKTLSMFIPRTLYGINCNIAFYHHDGLYAIGGKKKDRFNADGAMLLTALFIIEKTPNRWYLYGVNGVRRRLAERRLLKYYNAVRWGGKDSFTFIDEVEIIQH